MRRFLSQVVFTLLLGTGFLAWADVAQAQQNEKRDAFGDPLPAGAVARLGTIRFRPGGSISRLAFSPDGERLACWSETGLTVYDAVTGRELRHVALHQARAVALTWLKDGRGLAVLQPDRQSFYVWEFTDPKADPPRIPTPTGYSITSGLDHERFGTFAISPDGKYLAAGREGQLKKTRAIDLLELAPGKRVSDLKLARKIGPQPGDCTGLAFSHDQRTLLVFSHERGSQEERLVLYDPIGGEPRKRMQIPASDPDFDPQDRRMMFEFRPSKPFALAADDRTLAIGAGDGTVRVWDTVRGEESRSIAGHVKPVGGHPWDAFRIAFAAGGRSLITSGWDLRTCVWDAGTGRCIREIDTAPGRTSAVAVSSDGKRFATGGSEGQVGVWDAETGAANGAVADYPDVDLTTALAPDGRTVATVGTNGTICLWDLAGGYKRRRIGREHKRASQLSFTADGKALLVGGYASKTGLFDVASRKPLSLPGELASEPGRFAGLAPDSRTLLTTHEGVITLWDWPTGQPRQRFGQAEHNGWAKAHFSHDGRRLVTMTYKDGGATELWEVATGRRLQWLNIAQDMPPRAFLPPEGAALLLVDYVSRTTPPKDGDRWPAQPGLSLLTGCISAPWHFPPTAGCWPWRRGIGPSCSTKSPPVRCAASWPGTGSRPLRYGSRPTAGACSRRVGTEPAWSGT
jgi:WD40 repeat protein